MNPSERSDRIQPSATLSISERATELNKQGVDVVDFGAGEPDFPTPEPIKQAGVRAIEEDFTHYTGASGTPELKEAIRKKFNRDQGLTYEQSQVSVGCGAKHVLFNIMATALNPGDDVLLFSPYWVSYPNQIRFFGAEPVPVNTADRDFEVDLDRVKQAVSDRTRMMIVNSPSNPTGTVYPEQTLRDLTEFCLEEDLLLVSDEIYEKLRYTEEEHVSPAQFSVEAKQNTVIVNGVSKAYSMTGWRIGYAAGPESLIGGMNKLMSHSTSNPCSISQKAAEAALGTDDSVIQEMVDVFAERRDLIHRRLNDLPGVSCPEPRGAFYAFPDVSDLIAQSPHLDSDHDLTMELLDEAHVALVPGSAFGAPGHLRFSYAASSERIREGLDRFEDWIDSTRS